MLRSAKLIDKMKATTKAYQALCYRRLHTFEEVSCAATTRRDYRSEPRDLAYGPIRRGDTWGKSGETTWFVLDVHIKEPDTFLSLEYTSTDAVRSEQILVFENDAPTGGLDRNHGHMRLRGTGPCRIALEAYPFHTVPGNQPYETGRVVGDHTRTFQGIAMSKERSAVSQFTRDMKVLLEMYDILPENDLFRAEILAGLERVFVAVDAMPSAQDEDHLDGQMRDAVKLLRPLLAAKNGTFVPFAALTAHAHIDTAWQWDIAETTRKCARTFSTVLNLMRRYPDFSFVQSQPYQLECMKEYPTLYEEIVQLIAEGRWEINGGMYIEPDLNIPSGEALVRQLLYGQLNTKAQYGKVSDTLWMPDTFGFSAAVPQLMQGAGVRFFSTGKLAGNDTTRFPYDAFRWRGIDGTDVVACFSQIENGPSPQMLTRQWNNVQHKDTQHATLLAFGHGDGGGGPTAEMLEDARRTTNLQGCPRTYFTTVSRFMQSIPEAKLPVYDGELYFQLHRGTYTSISEVKRLNRVLEFRFREAEYFLTLAALRGKPYPQNTLDDLWKQFLVCQFHDILPGTAIAEVNDQAVAAMDRIVLQLGDLMDLPAPKDTISLHNYLGTPNTGTVHIPLQDGKYPVREGAHVQAYHDFDGKEQVAISGLNIPPMAARRMALSSQKPSPVASPFVYSGHTLTTPMMTLSFAEDGSITSLRTADGGELVAGRFNQFLLGEDIPSAWDNWDIDKEQQLKMAPEYVLVQREVVSDGPVELRIRSGYRLGNHSTLWQDMVFYADSLQIDFVTRVDWKGKRVLLKAAFDTTIRAREAHHEIQFGHLARPTHDNEPADRAMFEVCNHKWTDLSQADKGVALLNDCKYGISVNEGTMALSLLKSSTHPDTRADEGIHAFTYSLLPHAGGFDALQLLPAAYALNAPLAVMDGDSGDTEPLVSIDMPSILVESVKMAQHEHAVILRLYEAAGGAATGKVTINVPVKEAFETNLLEERREALEVDCLTVHMRPFEVKTLLLTL